MNRFRVRTSLGGRGARVARIGLLLGSLAGFVVPSSRAAGDASPSAAPTAKAAADESRALDAGLPVGTEAPDFRLSRHDQLKQRLSALRGQKNVILVFYPLAFTPV